MATPLTTASMNTMVAAIDMLLLFIVRRSLGLCFGSLFHRASPIGRRSTFCEDVTKKARLRQPSLKRGIRRDRRPTGLGVQFTNPCFISACNTLFSEALRCHHLVRQFHANPQRRN